MSPSINTSQDAQEAVQKASQTLNAAIQDATEAGTAQDDNARQMESDARFELETDGNVITIEKKTRLQKKDKAQKIKEVKKIDESILVREEDADGLAGEFSGRQGNREYHLDIRILSRLAQAIGLEIQEEDDPQTIIEEVRKIMTVNGKKPDAVILDKAFEFLLEAARSQFGKVEGNDKKRLEVIYQKLEAAKNQHFEENKPNIELGHKLIEVADLSLQKNQTLSIDDTIDFYRKAVHDITADVSKVRKTYPTYASLGKGREITFGIASKEIKALNLEKGHQKQLIHIIKIYQAIEGGYSEAKNGIKNTMKPYFDASIFARAA